MTAHSQRLGVDVHFGKQAATEPRFPAYRELRKAVKAAVGSLPLVPQHFGHGGDFAGSNWLMLGNGPDPTVRSSWTAARNGAGDCTIANAMHDEMEAAHGAGRKIPRFNGDIAIKTYSRVGEKYMAPGYNPITGANDNGLNMQDVVQYRQTTGIQDLDGHVYRLGAAVSLTPGDLRELWEAAYLFENVDLGAVITAANMDQFDQGLEWDHVPGSPEEGGHAFPVVGRSSLNNTGVITWAVRQGITESFIKNQVDEAHCAIDLERYNAVTGKTAEHFADVDLEPYLVMVAQLKGWHR